MTTYAFDTSAMVRVFERAKGGARVEELLQQTAFGLCDAVVSAVNWGEIRYTLAKLFGLDHADRMMQSLLESKMAVIPATAERAERAALFKARFRIGYADCFGVELAGDSADHILITADFGVKPAEGIIRIEFLPTKEKP